MSIKYEKSAVVQYKSGVSDANKQIKSDTESSMSEYNGCNVYRSRLCNAIDEAMRRAFNQLQAAESDLRSAQAKYNAAMQELSDLSNGDDVSAVKARVQRAAQEVVRATEGVAEATAVSQKTASVKVSFQNVCDSYAQPLKSAIDSVEENSALYSRLVSDSFEELDVYAARMDEADETLNQGGVQGSSPSGSTQNGSFSGTSGTVSGSQIAEDGAQGTSSSDGAQGTSFGAPSVGGTSRFDSKTSSVDDVLPGEQLSHRRKADALGYHGNDKDLIFAYSSMHTFLANRNAEIDKIVNYEGQKSPMIGAVGYGDSKRLKVMLGGQEYDFKYSQTGIAHAKNFADAVGDKGMSMRLTALYDEMCGRDTRDPNVTYDACEFAIINNNKLEYHTVHIPVKFDEKLSDLPSDAICFGNDADAAAQWSKEAFKEWRSSLSENEEGALRTYSWKLYNEYNNSRRHKEMATDLAIDACGHIDAAIGRNRLKQDIVVYRGINGNAISEMVANSEGKLEAGINLIDRANLSTSLVSDTNFTRNNKYIMRMHVLKDTSAAPLIFRDLAVYNAESEMTLGKNNIMYLRNVVKMKRRDILQKCDSDDEVVVLDVIVKN